MKRVIVAVCTIVVLAGCSGATNSGGKTSCADFLALRTADQDATVAKLLKERNGRNGSTGDVVGERQSLLVSCEPANRQGTPIGDLG